MGVEPTSPAWEAGVMTVIRRPPVPTAQSYYSRSRGPFAVGVTARRGAPGAAPPAAGPAAARRHVAEPGREARRHAGQAGA